MELFGRSLILADFPRLKSVRALGMSDKHCYSTLLEEKFDYRNTYYGHLAVARFEQRREAVPDIEPVAILDTGTNPPSAFAQASVPHASRLSYGGATYEFIANYYGGSGNDTYRFNLGDGKDTIADLSTPGMENRVEFGYGVSPDSLRAQVVNGELVLQIGDNGDALRFEGYNPGIPGMPQPVGGFGFQDGTSLSLTDLLANGYEIIGTPQNDILRGTDGFNIIRGLAGDDILQGGTGGDRLFGGSGDDTYIFNKGDGQLSIEDTQEPGCGNTLQFGPGIKPEDLAIVLQPFRQIDSDCAAWFQKDRTDAPRVCRARPRAAAKRSANRCARFPGACAACGTRSRYARSAWEF